MPYGARKRYKRRRSVKRTGRAPRRFKRRRFSRPQRRGRRSFRGRRRRSRVLAGGSRASIVGGGFYASSYRRPRVARGRRRWNRFRRRVAKASSAPFSVVRIQPISDPVTAWWNSGPGAASTHSWGLALNTQFQQSLVEQIAGVQSTFASPCVYSWFDLYDAREAVSSAMDNVYVRLTGTTPSVIIMNASPATGILPYVIQGVGSGNPALVGMDPFNADGSLASKDLEYTILSASLNMTITNNGTHTMTIKEYKCVFRKSLPNNYFGTPWTFDLTTPGSPLTQPHLNLYITRTNADQAFVQVGTQTPLPSGTFMPGMTPFKSRNFCRHVKIVGVRTIVLNGGQESKSYWRKSRPKRVNVADGGMAQMGTGNFAEPGSFFYLYTAMPSRSFAPNNRDLGISGTMYLQAEARVSYEVVLSGTDHKQWYSMDYRQPSLTTDTFSSNNFHMRNPFNLGDTTTAPPALGPLNPV